MNMLKDEVNIVKEIPPHLKPLDLESIGSLVCNSSFYMFMSINNI